MNGEHMIMKFQWTIFGIIQFIKYVLIIMRMTPNIILVIISGNNYFIIDSLDMFYFFILSFINKLSDKVVPNISSLM